MEEEEEEESYTIIKVEVYIKVEEMRAMQKNTNRRVFSKNKVHHVYRVYVAILTFRGIKELL